MPFADVTDELHDMVGVDISEPTARRHGQAAGAAYVALQTTQADVLQEKMPPPPPGPDLQQVSADGAMIPLVHKEWGEVRTVAIGVVQKPVMEKGEPVVHAREVSYFSRLCAAETFTYLALVEMHRRGTETAKKVCGVVDGAEWEQGFLDMHRPDAVRILDFSHAAGYLASAAQAAYGEGTVDAQSWYEAERHRLRHETPEVVLDAVRRLRDETAGPGRTTAVATITGRLAYLEKRTEQMRYAQFTEAGYPIGSGMVESGNKLVVEARLKGAGMHWARANVNSMLGLRNITCSDRWEEAWPQICRQMRRYRQEQSRERRRKRCEVRAETAAHLSLGAGLPAGPIQAEAVTKQQPAQQKTTSPSGVPSHRPAADHPWRRPLLPRRQTRSAHNHIQQET
jgi:hypothetical protein